MKTILTISLILNILLGYLYITKNSYTFSDDSEMSFYYTSTSTNYATVMSGKEYADQMMK